MVRSDCEDWTTLKFILLNSRWSGGNGFRTLEERMAEAVEQLPIGSELLALLLIEILEILGQGRSIKKVDARICSIQPPSGAVRSPVTRPVVKARKRR